MNIYIVPNLNISPKCKVYGRGGEEGAINNESIYTHTYTLSLSHTHTHAHTSITVSGKEGYWDGKRCRDRPCPPVFDIDISKEIEVI